MTDVFLPTPNFQILNKRASFQQRMHVEAASRNSRNSKFTYIVPETPMTQKTAPRRRRRTQLSIEKKRPTPTASKQRLFLDDLDCNFWQKYINLGEIGRGSFGVVYKAESEKDPSKIFALKKSRKELLTHQQRIMALKEVRIIEKLFSSTPTSKPVHTAATTVRTHPFIVRYYDSWIKDRRLHIAQEYFAHGTFKDVLTYNPQLTPKQILYCLLQMIYSLKFVHKSSIIHLDLKPENIFISEDYCLKIGDFGISHCVENSGSNATVPNQPLPPLTPLQSDLNKIISDPALLMEGDPAYVAPELIITDIVSQNIIASPAADMFSLGVILYEMLADVNAPSCGDAWTQLRNDKIDFDAETESNTLSNSLQSICQRMMASDPLQRPTCAQLWTELVAIGEENDIQLVLALNGDMQPPKLEGINLPPPIVSGDVLTSPSVGFDDMDCGVSSPAMTSPIAAGNLVGMFSTPPSISSSSGRSPSSLSVKLTNRIKNEKLSPIKPIMFPSETPMRRNSAPVLDYLLNDGSLQDISEGDDEVSCSLPPPNFNQSLIQSGEMGMRKQLDFIDLNVSDLNVSGLNISDCDIDPDLSGQLTDIFEFSQLNLYDCFNDETTEN